MIKLWGIKITCHPLFVLVMLASIFTGHFLELLSLFAVVFVHELGHVAAARMFGVPVISVQMLPFGGVAVIDDSGHLTPGREIVIALAGPLQNLLLIACSWCIHIAGLWDGPFLYYFIECNILIALFNLLPVLPLDGGKIWLALCSIVLPYHLTLIWTYRISMLFSVFIIGYGLIPFFIGQGELNANLLMIGSFLLYSNYVDFRNIPFRFIRFLMNRDRSFTRHLIKGTLAQPIVAEQAQPLDHILRLFKREKYHFIYIMNRQGNIVAVVPEQRVISSYFKGRSGT